MTTRASLATTGLGLCALFFSAAAFVPSPPSEPAPPAVRPWTARWISVPGASPTGYGVYHFRRRFTLGSVPGAFVVHVTADNRYQLFVNGVRAASGPARGDLFHWRYETVDLAPLLRAGENVLAAVAWNFGPDAPEAQLTSRTGFLLQGDTAAQKDVDTGPAWGGRRDDGYEPLLLKPEEIRHQYYVAGPGDRLTAARHLTQAGLRVTLLEARDRLGGRMYTESISEFPVELGAEFAEFGLHLGDLLLCLLQGRAEFTALGTGGHGG